MGEIAEIGTFLASLGVLVVAVAAFYLIMKIAGLVDALKEKLKES